MEFVYTKNPTAEIPVMLLLDDIGVDPETGNGIDGSKFLQELLALETIGPKSIEVWINSAGGVVADGYSIYSAIMDSKVPVDTKCIGMAASISAVIFEAGRNRIMNDYSWLMFHNPYGGDDQKLLEVMKGSLSKMIARSGHPEADILAMMKRTTYIYADEAKQLGLADQVDASDQKNKKRMSQIRAPKDFHKAVNEVINKLFDKTPGEMSMKLVTNKLNLNESASEDSILAAIVAIENKAKADKTDLEGKLADLQKAKDDIDAEMNQLKKEKDALAKAKDDLEKEKEVAEESAKEEQAKAAIKAYSEVGRIKNETKVLDFWVAQYMADPDETKAQIEALPLNKVAPVFNKTETPNGPRYTAGSVMAKINANRIKKQANK